MSNLAKCRTLTGHILNDVVELLKTTDPRLTSPILCNIEKGIVNPTPETLDALAAIYGTPKEALMLPEEVDYGIYQPSKSALRQRERRQKKQWKNFCALIPAELFENLEDDLRVCNYSDKKAWLMLKLKGLQVEAGIRRAKEQKKKLAKGQSLNAES